MVQNTAVFPDYLAEHWHPIIAVALQHICGHFSCSVRLLKGPRGSGRLLLQITNAYKSRRLDFS